MFQRVVFTRSTKFCEENRKAFDLYKVVSMDLNSALRTFLDPVVLPYRYQGKGSNQCRVSHRQLQLLTNGLGLKIAHKNNKIARLSTLKSVPRVVSILWVDSADLRWTHDEIQRLGISSV